MTGAELIPTLFILFLAAGILWIISRVIRRLFRSPAAAQKRTTIAEAEVYAHRREPVLQPVAPPPSTIPDAADVLALKAAIDNLAQQVAALEWRLASGEVNPKVSQPSPPATAIR